MAKVTQLPLKSERHKDRRRLHLREIADDPHAQLDSVGATLRAARINRGEDPDHVAAALKMRRDHVEAIEDNDFTRLPGRTYAIGFVRSYARYLGLDAGVMVHRFKEESAGREHDKPADLVFPEAPEENQTQSGSLFIVALVIAAVVAGIWYVSMPERRSSSSATNAGSEAAAVVVAEAAPAPASPALDLTAPPSVSSQLVQPTALLADGTASAPAATDAALPASLTIQPKLPAATPVPAPADATVPATATPAPAAATTPRTYGTDNAGSRVVFKATDTTYILVRDMTDPVNKITLFEGTLLAGETYRAPNKPNVTLRSGNAGGLQVEIDGKALGVLGKGGEVVNNVPVDPSVLLERMAAH